MLTTQATAALRHVFCAASAAGEFHPQFTLLAPNGMHGVVAQVQQGLLNLCGVGQHQWGVGGNVGFEVHIGGQGDFDQPQGFVGHVCELNRAALGWVVAAEGQNLLDQIARTLTGFVDFIQTSGRRT